MGKSELGEIRSNALEHRAVSVIFAQTADITAFESPMKYPPCTCRSLVCPDRQASTEPQPYGAAG